MKFKLESNSFITLLLLLLPGFCLGQGKILRLDDAIEMALKNSYDYKLAKNKQQTDFFNFQEFKAENLPTLYLDGIVPNYSRSINRITLPSGDDTFVSQNQAYSSLIMGLKQNVGISGGVVSLNTSLDRIDVFGDNRSTRYSSIPFLLSYSQNTIGYNSLRWNKKIEPLKYEYSKREYNSSLEAIASQTAVYYFDNLFAQSSLALSTQNLKNAERLYSISQERFKLGAVSKGDLMQLKMNLLNIQKQLTMDSLNTVLAERRLSSYLMVPDYQKNILTIPDDIHFIEIDIQEAIKLAAEHGQNVIDYKIKRLEAEKNLMKVRAESGLKFNVNANFGVSNTALSVPDILTNLQNQQNLVISFSLPILDWGMTKNQKKRAENNLNMVESKIKQDNLIIEQELLLNISQWNLGSRYFEMAKASRDISIQNYNLEMNRYLNGAISIYDLNNAQTQKDAATTIYLQTIKEYWSLYYAIRQLTGYDFFDKKALY
ncbi:TolC family protein [Pedobacter sp. AW31-3R]|uniref:TolC family protein n=1 Tax=Pedobacter sp. AW31-3R TaxID=3445781 RepID=UPI003F9FC45C